MSRICRNCGQEIDKDRAGWWQICSKCHCCISSDPNKLCRKEECEAYENGECNIIKQLSKLSEQQQDMPEDFKEVINENFWDLLE
jgi:hypothetical protein